MKIRNRLLLGFFAVALMAALVGVISLNYAQEKLQDSLGMPP